MARRQFGRPFPSNVFPLAATTVTDDFHRADENPIGAPWDTSAGAGWSGYEGAIVSQKFSAVNHGVNSVWGGADYAGLWGDYEAVCTIGTTTSTDTYYQLGVVGVAPYYFAQWQSVGISVFGINGGNGESFDFGNPGDSFGIRVKGKSIEAWYNKGSGWIKTTGWNLRESQVARPVGLFIGSGDAEPLATVTDFRIAALGEIITPRGRVRARRTAW